MILFLGFFCWFNLYIIYYGEYRSHRKLLFDDLFENEMNDQSIEEFECFMFGLKGNHVLSIVSKSLFILRICDDLMLRDNLSLISSLWTADDVHFVLFRSEFVFIFCCDVNGDWFKPQNEVT